MANARVKNCIYVDTVGTITVPAIRPVLFAVMLTPSVIAGRVIIKESVGGTIILDYIFKDVNSAFLNFHNGDMHGIYMSSSFEVSTLTTISVILYGQWELPIGRA